MDQSIQIIDNFLEPSYFNDLRSLMIDSGDFPWFYNDKVVNLTEKDKSEYNFQFTHSFYKNNIPQSRYFDYLSTLIGKLDALSIIRIKANLLTKTPDIIEHGYHLDRPSSNKFKIAVFYLNTNNGYTKFVDGTKVDSIANRICIFDSNLEHTGSTCTDEKVRVVINFNYFGK